QMRQGLAAHEATGTKVVITHFLALLAEALGKTGQDDEAFRLLEEAFKLADHNREKYYEAELLRIKGELILKQASERSNEMESSGGQFFGEPGGSAVSEAEACFHQALKIAQQQNAKSLELRAANSIARLYQSRNKQREAKCILGQIYESFIEGFDTQDLKEAKSLLRELS